MGHFATATFLNCSLATRMEPLSSLLKRRRKKQITSGIEGLDEILQLGDSFVLEICGSIATGKTALCLAYALEMLAKSGQVLWISPRVFPASRFRAESRYRPEFEDRIRIVHPENLDELIFLQIPFKVDLIIIEHLEYFKLSEYVKSNSMIACDGLNLLFQHWKTPVIYSSGLMQYNDKELFELKAGSITRKYSSVAVRLGHSGDHVVLHCGNKVLPMVVEGTGICEYSSALSTSDLDFPNTPSSSPPVPVKRQGNFVETLAKRPALRPLDPNAHVNPAKAVHDAPSGRHASY